MARKTPVIALLTDFGGRDGYVAAVKGVLLAACPRAALVDIAHEIDPGNILSASFVLGSVWEHFPAGTVFVAVVDPGVGTARRALVAAAGGRFLVAPDNGLASFLSRRYGSALVAHELAAVPSVPAPADTFHGRDVFAPAAALIARGRVKQARGVVLAPVLLAQAFSRITEDGPGRERTVHGCVVHLDRFGNAVTSIAGADLPRRDGLAIEFVARGRFVKEPYRVRLPGLMRTYGDVPAGKPLAYVGSAGFLEIGVRDGRAADRFGLRQGAPVRAGGAPSPAAVT